MDDEILRGLVKKYLTDPVWLAMAVTILAHYVRGKGIKGKSLREKLLKVLNSLDLDSKTKNLQALKNLIKEAHYKVLQTWARAAS
jgi:hypothetical protein